jgi:hypothetical protein
MNDAQITPQDRVDATNRWCLDRMTTLNQDILQRRSRPENFPAELQDAVLRHLPAPAALPPRSAQQLLVLLGLAGAGVARHYQEANLSHRLQPDRAFAGLTAGTGPAAVAFGQYFTELADRTGTGHGPRDSFASLVRWNAPAVEVEWDGQILARLPTVFEDGLVRTYTGAVDEQRFFGLLKASEALERAINTELMPLSDGSLGLDDEPALFRIARAVVLLDTLRELNHDFADRPPDDGLQITHFMDVFRQYAVHWTAGDIPPSGALDPEALIRDLIVGIDLPDYPAHLHRIFPGLLQAERSTLTELLGRSSLPQAALARAGLRPDEVVTRPAPELKQLIVRHPSLAALYLLLNAHARAAGVHLLLSKRFLFDPQRDRERAGMGDPGVVSNRTGTTGLTETRLELLTRVRQHHSLSCLRVLPARTLEQLARPPAIRAGLTLTKGVLVRFTGSPLAAHDLGLPGSPPARPHSHPAAPRPGVARPA